jgi:hypothetical protein
MILVFLGQWLACIGSRKDTQEHASTRLVHGLFANIKWWTRTSSLDAFYIFVCVWYMNKKKTLSLASAAGTGSDRGRRVLLDCVDGRNWEVGVVFRIAPIQIHLKNKIKLAQMWPGTGCVNRFPLCLFVHDPDGLTFATCIHMSCIRTFWVEGEMDSDKI